MDLNKWAVVGDGVYQAIGTTVDSLEPGMYRFGWNGQLQVIWMSQATDKLVELPDEASEEILRGMEKFWLSEMRYRKHGMLYKRGILVHGSPGGGKTALVALLGRNLIGNGGFVVNWCGAGMTSEGLSMLRKTHPKRRIICIVEDIDAVIDDEGDRGILALLDGESQVDGVIWLATTNHIDQLPATLVNRPSRFDEVIEIGMPSAAARKAYLQHVAPEITDDLERWVRDTEGFSIAHLKELALAVMCLDHPYQKALGRIRKMAEMAEIAEPKQAENAPRQVTVDAAFPADFGVLTAAAPEVTVEV